MATIEDIPDDIVRWLLSLNKQSWSFQNLRGRDLEWRPSIKPRNVTASGNVNPLDDLIRVDSTAGAVTMTLETAIGCGGREHTFKKIDSTANAMTIDGAGAETIDGAATKATTTQYVSFTIKSNGVGWDVI